MYLAIGLSIYILVLTALVIWRGYYRMTRGVSHMVVDATDRIARSIHVCFGLSPRVRSHVRCACLPKVVDRWGLGWIDEFLTGSDGKLLIVNDSPIIKRRYGFVKWFWGKRC